MTAISSILRQTIAPPNRVLAVCVTDDIAELADHFTGPRGSKRHKAFDIAIEAMMEACKRHGDHAELAAFLSHYQTCLDAGFDRHMTRGELQAQIDDETYELEKCAERIGTAFREEAYAGDWK